MNSPQYCNVRRHFCTCDRRCDEEPGRYFRPTMTCDKCGTESALYESHPTCRECLETTCEKCGTDYDPETMKITCNGCALSRATEGASNG